MPASQINLTGIHELDITGISGVSTAAGVTSFTVPTTAPAGVTGAIQYNDSGVFGGSGATASAAGSITLPSGQVAGWNNDTGLSRLGPASLALGIGTQGDVAGQLSLSAAKLNLLGTPATPVVTPTLGSASTWSYKIVAKDINGNMTAAGTAGTTTTGAATLDGTHFNTVTWAATPGAVSYDIYRTAHATSPTSDGKLGTVLATSSLSFVDNGVAASPASVAAPTSDSTGSIGAPGGVISELTVGVGTVTGGLRGSTFGTNALFPAVMGPITGFNGSHFALIPSSTASLNQQCNLKFYTSAGTITPVVTWIQTANMNNGGNAFFGIIGQINGSGQTFGVGINQGTFTTSPGVQFGGNGVNGTIHSSATSGTQTFFSIGNNTGSGSGAVLFNPASGSANFVVSRVNFAVNQTGTASGSYTGLLVNAIETALLGSSNLLLDLQAGATGGTSKFAINNSGIVTKYNTIATVSNGVPAEYATVDLTAQSAAIAATTLYAVPATGMYRVSWSATITTVDGAASVLGGTNGFQTIYTSPTDSVVKTTVPGNSVTSAANTTGTAVGGCEIVYAKTGTNIQYKMDYTSTTPGQMVYELHVKCEAL